MVKGKKSKAAAGKKGAKGPKAGKKAKVGGKSKNKKASSTTPISSPKKRLSHTSSDESTSPPKYNEKGEEIEEGRPEQIEEQVANLPPSSPSSSSPQTASPELPEVQQQQPQPQPQPPTQERRSQTEGFTREQYRPSPTTTRANEVNNRRRTLNRRSGPS